MESRNKINPEISGKEYFLQNSLVEHEQPNIYSLEAEFAETQKNRDFKPYLVFFGFIFLLILSTVMTTNYLEEKSKQVNIDISDFEDIRLKETLTAAKAKEQELHRKTAELDTKAKELNTKSRELENKKGEIQNLRSSYNNEVQRIKEQLEQESDLKNADKKALQRLDKKTQRQIEGIKKDYEAQLNRKQKEITRLQDQIKGYESQIADLKKKSNAGVNIDVSQRTVNSDEQVKEFFKVFNNPKLTKLSVVPVVNGDNIDLKSYRKELEQERVLDRNGFNLIRLKITQFTDMMKIILTLPGSNPATPPLKQVKTLTCSVINDYERLWSSLADQIVRKNQEAESYKYGLNAFLADKKAAGLIIDPRQRSNIMLFLAKDPKKPDEVVVDLYRGEGEYVGKMKLIWGVNGLKGELVESAKSLKPLDWFKWPE